MSLLLDFAPMQASAHDAALAALMICDPQHKCAATAALRDDWLAGVLGLVTSVDIVEPLREPGRPPRPELVAPAQLAGRSTGNREGHAALLHSIAHIEFNAINLALDVVWRFQDLPEDFYRDWIRVAAEEAEHFTLLRNHLREIGAEYGDFPAHNGLWDMAEKTAGDLLARMALVPRTLEARGLDVNPSIRAKLAAAGDERGAEILDRILADEIGHVAIGNRWYHWACAQTGRNPLTAHDELAAAFGAPRIKPPFNRDARLQAGFSAEELEILEKACT